MKFRIGWNFDRVIASLFGQEMKEARTALEGRLIFHMRFDNEHSVPNSDYAQAEEFLIDCRRLFDGSECPKFELEGETSEAAFLVIKYADCLWRVPDRPSQVYADALPVLHFGKQVGLVTFAIARETHQDAWDAAALLLPESAGHLYDPANWLRPCLWTGSVSGWAEKAAVLAGSFEEVAGAIYGFKKHGIFQFLIRGRLVEEDLKCFGESVLPLIREMEAARV